MEGGTARFTPGYHALAALVGRGQHHKPSLTSPPPHTHPKTLYPLQSPTRPPRHTHTHTHTHTHSHTHTPAHTHTAPHAHTGTHTATHQHVHTQTRTHPLSLSHTHVRTRTHSHTPTCVVSESNLVCPGLRLRASSFIGSPTRGDRGFMRSYGGKGGAGGNEVKGHRGLLRGPVIRLQQRV